MMTTPATSPASASMLELQICHRLRYPLKKKDAINMGIAIKPFAKAQHKMSTMIPSEKGQ